MPGPGGAGQGGGDVGDVTPGTGVVAGGGAAQAGTASGPADTTAAPKGAGDGAETKPAALCNGAPEAPSCRSNTTDECFDRIGGAELQAQCPILCNRY